ncbi:GGDEF-domain containing protein [Pseudoalteromonas sp. NBT06-2]|uniref:putative bifunctional diguanylate cyclase/phosphodiesterase n=1 Tax=Pseudoalteromonas sp. NBT06-2 TaxID=2025950 RepID=UPI000BA7C08B|nr:bifunctional diguanylate cyclase/phosphodiesterase [Pseudoalteromonas sp. NBT06-2]PAJ73907.1 GGDEF-domain containing protein [Pseudoalteromonas sp. NBT06-2]
MLVFCFSLLLVYIIFILSFTQGMFAVHQDLFPSSVEQISIEETQQVTNPILSALFLNNSIFIQNKKTYFVVKKNNDFYHAVPMHTMFNKVILLTNFPLLLLIFSMFLLQLYLSLKNRRKNNILFLQINKKLNSLNQTFNIPVIEESNHTTLSKLNSSLDIIIDKANKFQNESSINIFQDKLTGLSDRHAYLKHLGEQLEKAEKQNMKKCLLFIDLDGFKQVNDSFGHSFGDEILIQVAERLSTTVRNQSLSSLDSATSLEKNLSRLGGDEFSIFIENVDDLSKTVEVAQHVIQEIERDFVLGNKIIKIGASIGIAVYPDSAVNAHALLQMADVAMYRAKTDGRGIFRIYSPEMGNKMRRHHYLLEEMRLALANQNFKLSFQPIVNVQNCSILYFEALVRWNHPVEGEITPCEFIPIAEDSNFILPLGDWIMHEACREMAAWFNAGMKKVKISVNISGVQLKHKDLHPWVMDILEQTGLPPYALLLEITESCFIEATNKTIEQLELLRKEGVQIAIDDFGTGFSSLSTLADLPVDIIKIDKLFIDQANEKTKYNKILESISELGKKLNLKLVAEGVEKMEQFELVRKLGIQCVQGYLISRPETSRNIGIKVLKHNLNHIAMTGTNAWLPQKFNLSNKSAVDN